MIKQSPNSVVHHNEVIGLYNIAKALCIIPIVILDQRLDWKLRIF